MPDTYLVPGIQVTLWLVPALYCQGHSVQFGFTTVTIVLHEGTPYEFQLRQ